MTVSIKVLWVVPNLTQDNNQVSSPIASVRLRCLNIIRYFNSEQLNPEISTQVISCQTSIVLLNTARTYDPDLIIIGKLFSPLSAAILQLHQDGTQIALDICDDIFELTHLRKHYQSLFLEGLSWITASSFLQEKLQRKKLNNEINGQIFYVQDPPEGLPAKTTRPTHAELGTCESRPLELVWFGSYPNLEPLCDFLNNNTAFYSTLVIVTQLDARTKEKLKPLMNSEYHRIHPVQWSLEAQRHAIMKAHASIIPCGKGDIAAAKTANRLITSLWFGTPVVASPIQSYLAYEEFAFLDQDINHGVKRLLSTPWDTLEEKVHKSQRYIERQSGLDIIGMQWHNTICMITGQEQRGQTTQAQDS